MQHHPEARFQTPDELIAHYKAVFRRTDEAGRLYAREVECAARRRLTEELENMLAVLPKHSDLSAGEILRRVAVKHNVSVDEMKGQGRAQRIVRARWEAIKRIRETCPDWSKSRIARTLNKDHTVVIHALRSMGIE